MKIYNITKEKLIELYIDKNLSLRVCATIIGCDHNTVRLYLKNYKITLRESGKHQCSFKGKNLQNSNIVKKWSKNLNKNELKKLYIIQNKNISEIAKILKCGDVTVWKYLKLYNIPIKTRSLAKVWNRGLVKENDSRLTEIGKKVSKKLKGRTTWNLGLTKEIDIRVLKQSETYKKTHKDFSGTNHPMFGKKHSEETKKQLSLSHGGTGIPYENRDYPKEFYYIRDSILKRDNYICQNCGMTPEEHLIVYGEEIHVHHIDYNKKNCIESNLITLCKACNNRANYNRDYWINFYQNKILV